MPDSEGESQKTSSVEISSTRPSDAENNVADVLALALEPVGRAPRGQSSPTLALFHRGIVLSPFW
jgi:hypothetical protein